PVDLVTTERLAWATYRYAGLLEGGTSSLESTAASIARGLALPFAQLAAVYDNRGDLATARKNLERAARLAPGPAMDSALRQLQEESAARGR
ncbi:MAG: hypothetical protein ACREMO_00335, partial [Gemmatimonadales bacterium]